MNEHRLHRPLGTRCAHCMKDVPKALLYKGETSVSMSFDFHRLVKPSCGPSYNEDRSKYSTNGIPFDSDHR